MAQRRMFSNRITDSAKFLKMPLSSQALYFHLGLHADDDGVVEAFSVMRQTGAVEDDLRILVAKNFVNVLNDDLVAYITDWNENNRIRADRKVDSIYKDLLLEILPNIELTEPKPRADTGKATGRPMDNQWTDNGPHRLGKVRLGKVRLGKDSNIYSSSNDEPHIDSKKIKEIISYLNEKAGTKYRASGSKTQRLIKARFNDGFNDEDFKKVIDIKVAEWSGTDMAKYLRPETLFGTKFESYLNQEVKKSKTNKGGDSYGGLEF
ncbi:conserved phage C-terminal domain-containing protein [Pediococcus pentosaceus]|uniref:Conserved phage C-terminal domain-containing protein n=1 Tax=Pediococcus pentosaceus CGMCC 7049 TaxID=1460385 RepID=A0AAU7NIX3_PEDPE|nr:conserved phage C-terminal domain-containing protein [Pediococcus pentosaceus]MCV3324949.1 conserved phage C-terminal domain-containing protein [Pediococcus pentosaceus]